MLRRLQLSVEAWNETLECKHTAPCALGTTDHNPANPFPGCI
jgi:hypothetical protein